MAKTKVTEAPWSADGSLLHHVSDGRKFSHHESDAGERLEVSDIWEDIPGVEDEYGRWVRPIRIEKRTDYRAVYTEPVWRANEPFHASFQISEMRSGRSAKYLLLRGVNLPLDTRTYPMFVADLIDVAQRQGIATGGIMSGRWMVSKRGENYGLRLAKDGE